VNDQFWSRFLIPLKRFYSLKERVGPNQEQRDDLDVINSSSSQTVELSNEVRQNTIFHAAAHENGKAIKIVPWMKILRCLQNLLEKFLSIRMGIQYIEM
jgi:hypothetical protein